MNIQRRRIPTNPSPQLQRPVPSIPSSHTPCLEPTSHLPSVATDSVSRTDVVATASPTPTHAIGTAIGRIVTVVASTAAIAGAPVLTVAVAVARLAAVAVTAPVVFQTLSAIAVGRETGVADTLSGSGEAVVAMSVVTVSAGSARGAEEARKTVATLLGRVLSCLAGRTGIRRADVAKRGCGCNGFRKGLHDHRDEVVALFAVLRVVSGDGDVHLPGSLVFPVVVRFGGIPINGHEHGSTFHRSSTPTA